MKKQSIFITCLFIALLTTSCDWFTSPEELEPGRRDYVWTADTLNLEVSDFTSIWGSSPNDVWVGTYRTGEIFHFNGESWEKRSDIHSSGEVIFGFDFNNIWIGGGDGRIWHYNGIEWTENYRYVDSKFKFATIRDFAGINSDDLYAVGMAFCEGNFNEWTENQRAFVLHYNGYVWEEKLFTDFQAQFARIRKKDNSFILYSSSVDNMNGDTIEFYQYDGQFLNCIYSVAHKDCLFNTFNNIGNEILFLISDKVCRYTNGNFNELFSLQHSNLGGQIYGRNEKDMFVRMKDGLAHYNGENLEYLYTFNSTWTSIKIF